MKRRMPARRLRSIRWLASGPVAVLELTATPLKKHDPDKGVYASNVLYLVNALQVKNEGMIKLPIELESRPEWLDVLAFAVEKRAALAKVAAEWGISSGRTIRPVVLIQAQAKDKSKETHTVERVKEALIQQLKVDEKRIRIATGDLDDLNGEDLTLPGCTVEFVITVDKLREGWDCPFAYVLASLGKVATKTAVEQLLGRVLRMPQATKTGVLELDRAYAVIHNADVTAVARQLGEELVEYCGFDATTAKDAFRVHVTPTAATLFPSMIPVIEAPNLAVLPTAIQTKVKYEADTGTIRVRQPLTQEETKTLRDALPVADRAAVVAYWENERNIGSALKALDECALPLLVPQMAVRTQGRLSRFEPFELDEFIWDLGSCESRFGEEEFPMETRVGQHSEVDVSEKGTLIVERTVKVTVRQLSYIPADDNWEKSALVRWLHWEMHRNGQNAGLMAAESQAWLNRALDHLTITRGFSIPILVRRRHELAGELAKRLAGHGRVQVRKAASVLFLNDGERRLVTTYEMPFELDERRYTPYERYPGSPYRFLKHAFGVIGSMNIPELECAKKMDDHANVRRWLRNTTHASAGGFSLPLSPRNFFPDFISELVDGRTAIVEYKNAKLAQSDEERHKKAVGEMWAERSEGKGVFAWVVERDWHALQSVLG